MIRPVADGFDRLARIHAAAFEPHQRGWSAAEIAACCCDDPAGAADAGPGVWRGGWQHSAGFILVRAVAGEAEILTIAVDPAAQGQGQGGALLDHALAALAERATDEVFLEVAADNAAARGLYAARGFAEMGLRRGYYRRPGGGGVGPVEADAVDAIMMRWHRG